MRNMQKAILRAMLTPNACLAKLQDANDFTSVMAITEELKECPFGAVWERFCEENNTPIEWLPIVQAYEKDVLLKTITKRGCRKMHAPHKAKKSHNNAF